METLANEPKLASCSVLRCGFQKQSALSAFQKGRSTGFRAASPRAWHKSPHFGARVCLLPPANLEPAMNLRAPSAQYPGYFIRNLPPLKTPAPKVFYIMVIPKLPEPVSQSALGLSNIGPQSAVGVQHINGGQHT